MAAAGEVKLLYRALLKEGNKYGNYNFKEYVLRRVKEKFAEGRTLTGPDAVAALEQGKKEYEMVKRQADVSRMFTGMPSIMQKK
mmetsp:Transcript_22026/g.48343  ORF Transcript_22026/g.48343 Transcript_22026/m.48343 type:complete len:84 (-) Transcript_22026:228-479(-)|eukprot:CAMPEP_0118931048 /NCGR_PEP_ID=MMETSP1169-20130426/7527_1 /TAXON_ID=36882 /ORGANISM="Pyramimonas obovata, Strain CCMP722" /LENGTH=83 /DNA_ID=CAMNT_0006873501 /DNA_START=143 /DNA_END=394 /DNA_ORIENTATION=-